MAERTFAFSTFKVGELFIHTSMLYVKTTKASATAVSSRDTKLTKGFKKDELVERVTRLTYRGSAGGSYAGR
jgi:hypothetical protein